MQHSERKHAKLSASGAERWTQCPGSVKLSEGIPDRDSPWSLEGTRAHEVLENVLRGVIQNSKSTPDRHSGIPREMLQHVLNTARFVFSIHTQHPHSELLVEDRISLDFIHPDMWGTFDAAVVDHFGILHVFDFKYGAGIRYRQSKIFRQFSMAWVWRTRTTTISRKFDFGLSSRVSRITRVRLFGIYQFIDYALIYEFLPKRSVQSNSPIPR
jgi:hypothetical protein